MDQALDAQPTHFIQGCALFCSVKLTRHHNSMKRIRLLLQAAQISFSCVISVLSIYKVAT